MKKDELKLRINNAANSLIDIYFGNNTLVESLTNSTLKVVINMNINKLDDALNLVCDANGEINADEIISIYANKIGDEGVEFDIKDFIKSDFIRGIIPDKSLIIHKEDLYNIMKIGV